MYVLESCLVLRNSINAHGLRCDFGVKVIKHLLIRQEKYRHVDLPKLHI